MIPDDVLAKAWSIAAETVREAHPSLIPTAFDVREALRSLHVAASPGTVRAECARVGLRLADA
jgi:hypothetical protein